MSHKEPLHQLLAENRSRAQLGLVLIEQNESVCEQKETLLYVKCLFLMQSQEGIRAVLLKKTPLLRFILETSLMPALCYVPYVNVIFDVKAQIHCWFCDGCDLALYILEDEVQSISGLVACFIEDAR